MDKRTYYWLGMGAFFAVLGMVWILTLRDDWWGWAFLALAAVHGVSGVLALRKRKPPNA